MPLIETQKSSHWYKSNNGTIEPCYELPKKSGPGMKKVTLREARELGLLVSITTISNYVPKPFLQDWRVEQAILASSTLPRPIEPFDIWFAKRPAGIVDTKDLLRWAYENRPAYLETEDSFCKRVVEDMDAQSEKAKQWGISIHDAIAGCLEGKLVPVSLMGYLKDFHRWAEAEIEEVIDVERVVGSTALGIAGRLDLHCRLRNIGEAVVDFKTQNIKKDKAGIKQAAFYKEFPLQLAAYARCCDPNKSINLVSVIIDSSEPGPIFVKVWPDAQLVWEAFQRQLWLWCYHNDYDPACK